MPQTDLDLQERDTDDVAVRVELRGFEPLNLAYQPGPAVPRLAETDSVQVAVVQFDAIQASQGVVAVEVSPTYPADG